MTHSSINEVCAICGGQRSGGLCSNDPAHPPPQDGLGDRTAYFWHNADGWWWSDFKLNTPYHGPFPLFNQAAADREDFLEVLPAVEALA